MSLALNLFLESSKTEINFLIIRGDTLIMMVETTLEFEKNIYDYIPVYAN